MPDFEIPTKEDFDRALSTRVDDCIHEMKMARLKVSHTFPGGNATAHSRYPVLTAQEFDTLHRAFVRENMEVIATYIDRPASVKELGNWTKPHFDRLNANAIGEVPEGASTQKAIQDRYRPQFQARTDDAIRDLELGLVNGKRVDQVTGRAKVPLHLINNEDYVDAVHLEALRKMIPHPEYDLRRLVKLCEEINSSWQMGNYFAVPNLVRTVMDHVPPVFGGRNFDFIKGNHGDRTFKDHMERLDESLRLVADASLHRHIRKSDVLPTPNQVNFAAELAVLLGEVVAKLTRP